MPPMPRKRRRESSQHWDVSPRTQAPAIFSGPLISPAMQKDEEATIRHGSYGGFTPSLRGKSRGSSVLILGGAQHRGRRRSSLNPTGLPLPTPHSTEREEVIVQTRTASQPAFVLESMEIVNSAAIKSRIRVMQTQIERLEREKMELGMSKAPLEARIGQKGHALAKESERFCAEIEAHHMSLKGDRRGVPQAQDKQSGCGGADWEAAPQGACRHEQ